MHSRQTVPRTLSIQIRLDTLAKAAGSCMAALEANGPLMADVEAWKASLLSHHAMFLVSAL